VDIDRNPAAIILDRHTAIDVDYHTHLLGIVRHALVDRVVHDLVDEVVQPAGSVVADVHAEPLTNMVAIRKVLQVSRRVAGLGGFVAHQIAPRGGLGDSIVSAR
jgi:hypothetical protein